MLQSSYQPNASVYTLPQRPRIASPRHTSTITWPAELCMIIQDGRHAEIGLPKPAKRSIDKQLQYMQLSHILHSRSVAPDARRIEITAVLKQQQRRSCLNLFNNVYSCTQSTKVETNQETTCRILSDIQTFKTPLVANGHRLAC